MRGQKKQIIAILLFGVLVQANGESSQNKLVNGSFESISAPADLSAGMADCWSAEACAIDGWEYQPGIYYVGSAWAAADGVASISLNGSASGSIQQIFTTIPGKTYLVRFQLSGTPDGDPNPKILSVDAAGQSASFVFDKTTTMAMQWESHDWHFVADDESATIRFSTAVAGVAGPVLDDVVVLAVPDKDQPALNVDLDAQTNGVASPVYQALRAGSYRAVPIGIAEGAAFTAWSDTDNSGAWQHNYVFNAGSGATSVGGLDTFAAADLALQNAAATDFDLVVPSFESKVLFLGDSRVAGNIPEYFSFVPYLTLPVQSTNLGADGNKMADVLHDLPGVLSDYPHRAIVLAAGANDFRFDTQPAVENVLDDCLQIVDLAIAAGRVVLVLPVLPVTQSPFTTQQDREDAQASVDLFNAQIAIELSNRSKAYFASELYGAWIDPAYPDWPNEETYAENLAVGSPLHYSETGAQSLAQLVDNALQNAQSSINAFEVVDFWIADSSNEDNQGGVSLSVIRKTDVEIDVLPASTSNQIDPAADLQIPVSVLSSSSIEGDPVDFDATDINPATLKFGIGRAENTASMSVADYDGDTLVDAGFGFSTSDSLIVCDDTSVMLEGETYAGEAFVGYDSIDTSNCDTSTGCHP